MKLKNEIFNDEHFITAIQKINEHEGMRPVHAFQFFNISKQLTDSLDSFEKIRIKIAQKYGTFDEKQQAYVFANKDKTDSFQVELRELLDIEIEIDVGEKIPYPETLSLSPNQIKSIEPFFDFTSL